MKSINAFTNQSESAFAISKPLQVQHAAAQGTIKKFKEKMNGYKSLFEGL